MKRQEQKLEDNGYDLEDVEIMLVDDEAYYESLVGITDDERAVYDKDKMAEEYAAAYKCSYEEAMEYIEYNIVRALPYYENDSPKGPILFNKLF